MIKKVSKKLCLLSHLNLRILGEHFSFCCMSLYLLMFFLLLSFYRHISCILKRSLKLMYVIAFTKNLPCIQKLCVSCRILGS